MAVQTQDRPQQKTPPPQRQEVAVIERLAPMRLPITHGMMEKLGVSEADYRVLTDQIFPGARTVEAISLALAWCRHRNLDIMKRPCHIVPMYSTALKRMVETVWPSIAEIRTTATRTRVYAGIDDAEFGPMKVEEFIDRYEDERDARNNKEIKRTIEYPEWCKIVVWRFVQGEKCSFSSGKVWWREAYATAGRNTEMPNEMWRKRVFGQIEKCAEAAALRRAFPEELGNEYAAEEMEGKVIDGEIVAYADPGGAATTAAPVRKAPRPPSSASRQHTVAATTTTNEEAKINAAAQPGTPDAAGDEAGGQVGAGNVVDAEAEDITDPQGEPFDFEEFQDRIAEAPDLATIQEIWEHFGVDETFADDPAGLTVAVKIKVNRLKQLKAGAPA
jgi:phage recombination protein Bet